MSCSRTVKAFEVVEIVLDTITKKELEELESKVKIALQQKLEKLNLLIKETNIYSYNGAILINDRYKIAQDLEEVAKAFGLTIKKIECGLRGNNYIVTDALVGLLKEIGVTYDFGLSLANQQNNDAIIEAITANLKTTEVDKGLLQILNNVRINGRYVNQKRREVTTTYNDWNNVERRVEGEWSLDENEVREKLSTFALIAQNNVNKINKELVEGTTKLIHSRARQMGYAVEQVKKGKEIQLVLVRMQ